MNKSSVMNHDVFVSVNEIASLFRGKESLMSNEFTFHLNKLIPPSVIGSTEKLEIALDILFENNVITMAYGKSIYSLRNDLHIDVGLNHCSFTNTAARYVDLFFDNSRFCELSKA